VVASRAPEKAFPSTRIYISLFFVLKIFIFTLMTNDEKRYNNDLPGFSFFDGSHQLMMAKI
jgi:hypothetical protein